MPCCSPLWSLSIAGAWSVGASYWCRMDQHSVWASWYLWLIGRDLPLSCQVWIQRPTFLRRSWRTELSSGGPREWSAFCLKHRQLLVFSLYHRQLRWQFLWSVPFLQLWSRSDPARSVHYSFGRLGIVYHLYVLALQKWWACHRNQTTLYAGYYDHRLPLLVSIYVLLSSN